MLKKMLVTAIVLSAFSTIASAGDMVARAAAVRTIELQDGSTVYVFKSGKMAVENKYGNVAYTKPGTILQAKDGSSITMVGNEVAYLSTLLDDEHNGDLTP